MNVKITRDKNGIAHVSGKNLADLYWGLGYAHGRDRGLQLLLMRILGQGRASQHLDASDETLNVDIFFRRMNWYGTADRAADELAPEVKTLAESYCSGVNKALQKSIPWELKLLGYRPEPWHVADIILIMRMMGYLTLAQSQGEMERLLVEMVQAGIGQTKLEALFPGLLNGMDISLIRQITLGDRIVSPVDLWHSPASAMMASNNWVVSGDRSMSGKPILANDPHIEINRLPNVWYESVLKTDTRYIMGVSIPGAPGIVVGRNNDLAWGATYAFMDATDSWIEQCRDGNYFREPDEWIAFTPRPETIHRKKKPDAEVTFYENHHGVLDGDPHVPGYYLCTRWAPAESGAATVAAAMQMFEVSSVQEGMDRVKHLETAWNVVFADTRGNIGYQMSGLMPKRRGGISGLVPLAGWKTENDWQGFVDPDTLPRCLNPSEGLIVTANENLNHMGSAKPINISMGPYRSDRIASLLRSKDKLRCEDMYTIQKDVYSTQAEAFMKILAPLLPDTPQAKILKNWDCRYDPDSQGAWLFERFYKALYKEVFGKFGFGTDVVEHLDRETGIFVDFYLNFDRVLLADDSPWFNGENRDSIYVRALSRTVSKPPKPWGESQQVMMTHLLFGGRLPRWLGFDHGPITIIGNRATPNQGQIYQSGGRTTSFAPSIRMVTDLATDALHTNMAGGPSDRRFSRWYTSDVENWKMFRYKEIKPDAEAYHDFS